MKDETAPSGTADAPSLSPEVILSAYGKLIASRRRMDVEGKCPVCRRSFVGSIRKKYDRQACAVAAYKERQKKKAEGAAQAAKPSE